MISFNRAIFFIGLILIYLGIAKMISPTGGNSLYVKDEQSLYSLFNKGPLSVVLIDYHSTGYIIKTHYQKYRIIYDYNDYEEKIVRVSNQFRNKNIQNLGMSIFRIDSKNKPSHIPTIPGFVFWGNPNYGEWRKGNSKTKNDSKWFFYRSFHHFRRNLNWQDFSASYPLFQKAKNAFNNNEIFFGDQYLFGTSSKHSKQYFPRFYRRRDNQIGFTEFISKYLKRNF